MPAWFLIGGLVVAGLGAGGYFVHGVGDAAEEIGDAAKKSEALVKWAVVGGSIYVSYRALKSAGAV